MKINSSRVIRRLALCVLPLSACADASDADTLRKLTALAEHGSAAAAWRANPSPLTLRAKRGVVEAKELIQ